MRSPTCTCVGASVGRRQEPSSLSGLGGTDPGNIVHDTVVSAVPEELAAVSVNDPLPTRSGQPLSVNVLRSSLIPLGRSPVADSVGVGVPVGAARVRGV